MIRFENDDRAYLEWLRDNQSGYVLNVRVAPDPGYVLLHRATCRSISSDRRAANAYIGAGYRKICSNDIDELARAAKAEGARTDHSPSDVRTAADNGSAHRME